MPAYFVAIRRNTTKPEELKIYKTTAGASFAGRTFKLMVDTECKVRVPGRRMGGGG